MCIELTLKNLCIFIITFSSLYFSPIGLVTAESNSHIRSWIEDIRTGNCARDKDCPISSVILLPELYVKYNYQPIWKNPDSIRQLIDAIKNSYHDGLTPQDYHLFLIQELQSSFKAKSDPAIQAKKDVVFTDALIRLSYHLLMGKVDPESLDNNWNMSRESLKMGSILRMSAYIDNAQVTSLIASFRPQVDFYRDLKRALANYRKIQAEGGWPQLVVGDRLKPGMASSRVRAIGQRLYVTGDIQTRIKSDLYDDTVEAGVERFQYRHGLEVNGLVDKQTLDAMNVSVEARIDQLRVNLDRARWVLHDLPQNFVVVDIAGFNVKYIRSGQEVWKTRAIVGKTYRKTPVFRGDIRYIIFNPTWTVPPTILREDILPKIKQDLGYLQNKNMVVLNQMGKQIDPTTIDWTQYPGNNFPYLIRQQPGPKNTLGRVKFMFPNKHAVYLHDTPRKSAFKQVERALSSGCIRIQNPLHFAKLLLEDKPGWSRTKVNAVVETRAPTHVNLAKPLAVMLLYWTAEVDSEHRVIFKQDIYDRDGTVLTGLQSNFAFRDRKIIE